MRPFDPEAICPKCASDDIGIFWVGAGASCIGIGSRCTLRWSYPKPEHIERNCRRCHYQWNEAPVDASAKALA